jgi:hypothetical protein
MSVDDISLDVLTIYIHKWLRGREVTKSVTGRTVDVLLAMVRPDRCEGQCTGHLNQTVAGL